MQGKRNDARVNRVAGSIARGAVAATLAVTLVPVSVIAAPAATADASDTSSAVTTWKEVYDGLDQGIDTSKGYDVVTSATNFTSRHAGDIATIVDKVADADGSTTGLDGVKLTGKEATVTPRLSSATYDYNATRGDGEFVVRPDDTVEGYTWNDYFNSIYAVTVSDGTTTTGAVPWVDWYGENATEGYHYNKLEVALNNGESKGSNKADVDRFSAFYDENGNVRAGSYTVTVYAEGYEPLVASGIVVLPTYTGTASATEVLASSADLKVTGLPEDIQNPKVTVSHTEGQGRSAVTTTLAEDVVPGEDGSVALDEDQFASLAGGASIDIEVDSDNYAPIKLTSEKQATSVAVYRLYNPYDHLRLYTTSKDEYDSLVSIGWNGEDIGWQAPTTGTAVYRLYNQYNGEHLYTTDAAERDGLVPLGWSDEGIAFYSDSEADGVAIRRFYNPYITGRGSTHHYTSDADEASTMVSDGWVDEGIAFYGLPETTEDDA